MAHAGCQAGDLRVTPFNGRLFAPAHTPLTNRRDLDDGAARRAILALSTRTVADRAATERIAYRDLGVEQLGAVYETLLDYTPGVKAGSGARRSPSVSLEPGSGVRKSTGTFYTPQAIAQFLVHHTLQPLVADASPERVLALRVLDPAMGSGAFLVAACSFLTEAYEAALVRCGACHASDIGPAERVTFRRTIAERCLYGVDLNPMAVQLARLSVWLSTLSASKPLGFLDHHFLVGDSLLGAWISSLRDVGVVRRRRANPATLPLFDASGAADAVSTALPVRFALSDVPNDSLDQVREKERSLADLNRSESPLSRWRRIANVWCATRFDCGVPASAFGALTDAILTGRSALPPATATRLLEQADRIAATQRFFHWELEFPEAFFDRDGARLAAPGFDAVLGNPPWDMMRADAGSAASRDEARRVLNTVVRFTRDAGIYTAQSPGHANRYQLFIERALSLTRHGGRIGLVLPWGFLNDQGSARLRRLFLTEGSVDTVIGFENRRGLFPIHRGVRFVLTTSTKGMPTTRFGCRLGEQDPSVLESMRGMEAGTPSRFPVQLTPALLERLSGEDLAIPDLRAPIDLAIVERAASLFPPLGHPSGWDVRFGRELNATEDRQHFSEAQGGLPVVEGKALVPFRVRLGLVRHRLGSSTARQLLGNRHLQPRLAYRDVASSTNRVTLIAAVLPAGTVSTHTVFCLRTPLPLRHQFFLCGMFNSFVVNYLTRLRVTTHVTTGIVERLPIPSTLAAGSSLGFIAACARLLARRDAAEVQAALEARVARLYQLSEAEFSHVLDTFPLVPMDERAAALQAFRTGA
jgi:hypothetical protein